MFVVDVADSVGRWYSPLRSGVSISTCHTRPLAAKSLWPARSVEGDCYSFFLLILDSVSLFLPLFSRWTLVGRYQNVSILGFIGAKGDGGGGNNWAIRDAKHQSKCWHQQTNTQFLRGRCPSCRPTNSVEALKGTDMSITIHRPVTAKSITCRCCWWTGIARKNG